MKEQNLLASAALFSELYNDDNYQNISDIIAEFIKGAITLENKYSFNSTEITDLLEKIYEFQIPESVVRTTLNNKLKGDIERKDGYYHYKSAVNLSQSINHEHETIIESQNKLFLNLIGFIEQKENRELEKAERAEVFENFTHFLFDNGFADKFSNYISAYIILNEKDVEFTNSLNIIREGIILYQGIRFTADINELGKWNTDLTLYLNTEQLFNATGYNGILYQEIFNDFTTLVYEINSANKSTNQRKRIELKYFEETKREVDNFFLSAESIIRGHKKLDPSRAAMKMVLENCHSASDIKAKRVKFDLELKRKGIDLQEFNVELSKMSQYNVEDQNSIDELQKLSMEKGREFDDFMCSQYFKIFTKINYYRKGESNKPFERIGHLLITDNGFAKYLAHHNLVKFDDDAISFAKDMDFIITRLWFKLKKGFSNKQSLPKSFDVVTKARLILSSHINSSISSGFQKLVGETKNGKLTKEEALARSYEFREKPNRPEDITTENIDDSLAFLNNETYFEDIYREKERKEALLNDIQRKNQELENEIKKRDLLEKQKQETIVLIAFIKSNWKDQSKKNWKDFSLFFAIFLLNSFLSLLAIVVSVDKRVKDWLSIWGRYQIFAVALYILVIVTEVLGRSYLFNKERLKSGWSWFLTLITFNYSRNKREFENELERKFTEVNKAISDS